MQVQDELNIKCSVEIKNGIPQRSLNNFHKNQNALVLNNYTVSNKFMTESCFFRRDSGDFSFLYMKHSSNSIISSSSYISARC